MTRLRIGLDASFMMTFDEGYSLKYLVDAEKGGFDYLWLGDHFLPWHHSFRHSFFVWEVLAAVAARTRSIKVGPDVTVPIGGRYHPAIIAQASATMDNMFPGRFALGLGSGEAMNEARFMSYWPKWPERTERLIEGIDLIKKLWTEKDYFDFYGKYFKMPKAFYHLKPRTQIPIYFSSVGEKSAYQAGIHADRLMTVGTVERCKNVIFPKFQEGARSVGRDPSKMETAVLVNFATGPREKIVRRLKNFQAGSMISGMFNEVDPRKIEEGAKQMSADEILHNMYVFDKGDEVIEVLSGYQKIGANQVIFSEMSADPDKAMRVYAEKVIPYFKRK